MTLSNLKQILYILLRTGFLVDYVRSCFNDKFIVSNKTYLAMRWLFVITGGLSNRILAMPFKIRYSLKRSKIFQRNYLDCLDKNGFLILDANAHASRLAALLRHDLASKQLREDLLITSGEKPLVFSTLRQALQSPKRRAPRLFHNMSDVFSSEYTWQLIDQLHLVDLAAQYFRCEPILTQVQSWHVLPLRDDEYEQERLYDHAAQSFHFDMDWLQFLKFFINLTDVNEEDGPFEYQLASHSGHHQLFDQRHAESELMTNINVVKAVGNCGTCFVADTSGLHRDGRVMSGGRQVLQVEFAVAAFGALQLYQPSIQDCKRSFSPENMTPFKSFRDRVFTLYK